MLAAMTFNRQKQAIHPDATRVTRAAGLSVVAVTDWKIFIFLGYGQVDLYAAYGPVSIA
jgi:hypothetical protein